MAHLIGTEHAKSHLVYKAELWELHAPDTSIHQDFISYPEQVCLHAFWHTEDRMQALPNKCSPSPETHKKIGVLQVEFWIEHSLTNQCNRMFVRKELLFFMQKLEQRTHTSNT